MENLIPYTHEILIVVGWIVSLIVFQTRTKSTIAHLKKEHHESVQTMRKLENEFRQKVVKMDNVIDLNEKACKDTLKDVAVLEFQVNVLNEEVSKVRVNQHAFANETHKSITELSAQINVLKGTLRVNV